MPKLFNQCVGVLTEIQQNTTLVENKETDRFISI